MCGVCVLSSTIALYQVRVPPHPSQRLSHGNLSLRDEEVGCARELVLVVFLLHFHNAYFYCFCSASTNLVSRSRCPSHVFTFIPGI